MKSRFITDVCKTKIFNCITYNNKYLKISRTFTYISVKKNYTNVFQGHVVPFRFVKHVSSFFTVNVNFNFLQ